MSGKKVTIIASCHVFDLKKKIVSIIEEIGPGCVCIELDEKRLERLKREDFEENPLSALQRDIARIYGADLGNDMLGAVEGAESVGAELLLIDEDIEDTMAKIKEALSSITLSQLMGSIWSDEKDDDQEWMKDASKARDMHSLIELLVRKFEEDPDSYRGMLSSNFPQLSKILLDEREEFMFRGLEYALSKHDNVVAVVGAGHISELEKRLSSGDVKVDAIQVKDVRRWGMDKVGIS